MFSHYSFLSPLTSHRPVCIPHKAEYVAIVDGRVVATGSTAKEVLEQALIQGHPRYKIKLAVRCQLE